MKWGMFVYGSVVDGTTIEQWLKSYDLDAVDMRFVGGGTYTFTHDASAALAFDNAGDVLRAWQQQAKAMPVRPDGRPNRPLTQFSVSPDRLGEVE